MTTFQKLWAELDRLSLLVDEAGKQAPALTRNVHPELRASAANLIDYLALRQVDLRPLQFELEREGLSSLGRMEGHVRDALSKVRSRVRDGLRQEAPSALTANDASSAETHELSREVSEQVLHRHTHDLLGPRPRGRHIYVMVTAPSAAEADEEWATRLLGAGMNVLRVNAAHEGPDEWHRIVETARRAAAAHAVPLRVLVDLPGPKLRTVAAKPGPRVVRFKPQRDALGRVSQPCCIELYTGNGAKSGGKSEPGLQVPQEIFMNLAPGDDIVFSDARGRRRHMAVAVLPSRQLVAYLRRTAYLVPGTRMEQRRAGATIAEFFVSDLPEQPFHLRLASGECLRLQPAPLQPQAESDKLPVIGCSLPAALAALEPGQRVVFDDGKIECVAEARVDEGVVLRVTRARAGGAKLFPEKGINLPDTTLPDLGLSPGDEQALAFAKDHADMVGLSFIRNADGVRALYRRIEGFRADFGVVLKIETATAFRELPDILLTAMSRYPLGVMIARGDLAIEVGFERLAEVQEELLWVCEAAQLPVIWATEVLAQLARQGVATRAEVTDAAMSVRAECVMLNKGPRIDVAVAGLVDILRRMERHQYKKRSLHRKLSLVLPRS